MSNTKKIKESIFIGRNNTFTIEFEKPGMDFSTVTKVEFELNGKPKNSTGDAAFFDITTGPFPIGFGTFVFKMGEAGFLETDSGDAIITLFDPSTPLGLQFAGSEAPTQVEVKVFDD